MLKKYELTWERKREGEILKDFHKVTEVESYIKPKIGEGMALLAEPPIFEYIIKVEEITDIKDNA